MAIKRVKTKAPSPKASAESKRKKATTASTGKKKIPRLADPQPTRKRATQTKVKSKSKTKSKVKTKTTKVKTSTKEKFSRTSFPIVGIGASAGGLQAFEDFFAHMGSETGMSFIVVTHLHPEHVSALPELIGKCTGMEVLTVKDCMSVRQNCIYLIPPGVNLSIFNKTLHLAKLVRLHASPLPIDFFFRSLAEDQKDKALGIILSGTGTDGTLGIRAIKGESGMVIVQDIKSAKFSGMPQSAIDTGLVDYILPPHRMPKQLVKYVKGPFLSPSPATKLEAPLKDAMQKIFLQIRQRTGHDFSCYKSSTIRRRVERRMNVHHIQSPASYVRFIQENPEESDLLFKDMLIGVTSFFRDPKAYEFLSKKGFPKLLQSKPEGSVLRVWIPACASGEEAYSLAIALRECMEKVNRHLDFQIFATDLDLQAIDIARTGIYPEGIAADVGSQRLKKFFLKEKNRYRIRKDIRETVIFAPHNVITNPPFTKLDMVSCRNLLIYLEPEVQKKIFNLFHYALKPEGILFLGSSETIGSQSNLFKPTSKQYKVFLRQKSKNPLRVHIDKMPQKLSKDESEREESEIERPSLKAQPNILDAANRVFLEHLIPPSLIINHQDDIIFIHGKIEPFLEMPPGRPSKNILLMAREGLKVELISALRRCKKKNKSVDVKNIPINYNGKLILTDLTVQNISKPPELHGFMLVAFHATKSQPASLDKKEPKSKKKKEEADKLKKELQYTKETLQSAIEEQETTNEELKSTNEELQSTNEELQSSNEEIETSKEEMQSLNEELQTTNMELQTKLEEHSHASDDMKNLLNSTRIATLFLDNGLNIRRFTPMTKKIVNLIDSDVGRPISDISFNFKFQSFIKECRGVVKTLAVKDREVQTNEGVWYLITIMPYRTSENRIDGLVLTFVDIDQTKRSQQLYQESKQTRRLAAVVRDSNDAITVQSLDGKIIEWNHGAEKTYGYNKKEALKKTIYELVPSELHSQVKKLSQKIAKGKTIKSFLTKRISKKKKILEVWVTVTALKDEAGTPYAIATTERDVSGVKLK